MYLDYILDDFKSPWNLEYNNNGQLYAFDQTKYTDGKDSRLFDHGYIYIPDGCDQGE